MLNEPSVDVVGDDFETFSSSLWLLIHIFYLYDITREQSFLCARSELGFKNP